VVVNQQEFERGGGLGRGHHVELRRVLGLAASAGSKS